MKFKIGQKVVIVQTWNPKKYLGNIGVIRKWIPLMDYFEIYNYHSRRTETWEAYKLERTPVQSVLK